MATAGELWAQDALATLRAGRWRPDAIRVFLSETFARAAASRTERPALAAQARAWSLTGAVAWTVLAALRVEPFRRRARSGLTWWATVAAMLDWHLAMFETADGHPRMLSGADALTLGRAWLVPVLADDLRVVPVMAAATTDVLDGVVARAGSPTRAGRDLEGLVDAAAAGAALIGARRNDRLARGVVALEGLRLAAGYAYVWTGYLRDARSPGRALVGAARATTSVRIGGLALAGAGHRRSGGRLLGAGSIISLVLLAAVDTPPGPGFGTVLSRARSLSPRARGPRGQGRSR